MISLEEKGATPIWLPLHRQGFEFLFSGLKFQCYSLLTCHGGWNKMSSRNLFQCKMFYSFVISLQENKRPAQDTGVTNVARSIGKTTEKNLKLALVMQIRQGTTLFPSHSSR